MTNSAKLYGSRSQKLISNGLKRLLRRLLWNLVGLIATVIGLVLLLLSGVILFVIDFLQFFRKNNG